MKVLDIIKPVCAYLGLYQDYLNYYMPSAKPPQEVLQNQISLQDLSMQINDENTTQPTTIPQEKKDVLSLLILAINNIQQKILKTINLVTEEEISLENNEINISSLSKKLNKVINIKSSGKKLNFAIVDNCIKVNNSYSINKTVKIKYSYFLPFIESLDDDLPLEVVVKERTIALGVTSEYCYIAGLFDDAEIWHKKFLQELNADSLNLKNFSTPKRSWR